MPAFSGAAQATGEAVLPEEPFPQALFEALNHPPSRGLRNCLAWSDNGESFEILDLALLRERLLGHFSKLAMQGPSLSLFFSLLERYSFERKLEPGHFAHVYAHENFVKQRRRDLWRVRRASLDHGYTGVCLLSPLILSLVARYLSLKDTLSASSTCKMLARHLAEEDEIWLSVLNRDFLPLSTVRLGGKPALTSGSPTKPGGALPLRPIPPSKAAYQRAHRVMLNWQEGYCTDVYSSHKGVIVVSSTNENFSAVFSDAGFLDVLEAQTGKLGRSYSRVSRMYDAPSTLDVRMLDSNVFYCGGVAGAFLFDTHRGNKPQQAFGPRRTVSRVCLVENHSLFATAGPSSNSPVLLFDAQKPSEDPLMNLPFDPNETPSAVVGFASSHQRVVAMTGNGTIMTWDTRCGQAQKITLDQFSARLDDFGTLPIPKLRNILCADANDSYLVVGISPASGVNALVVIDWRKTNFPTDVKACDGSLSCVAVGPYCIVAGVTGSLGPLATAAYRNDCLKQVGLATSALYGVRKLSLNHTRLAASCTDASRLLCFA